MRSITGNVRRATEDLDLDFIRYSLEDESIRYFISKLNCLDGIRIEIKGNKIEQLSQQEYSGKRVYIIIKDDEGNVTLKCQTQLYDSKNNIVVLPSGKLAVIAGMEGYLIAESDNVLLICPKDQESAIRKYVNDAQIRFGNDFI